MPDSPRIDGDGLVKFTIFTEGNEIDDSYKIYSIAIHKKINKIPYATIVVQDGDMPKGDFPISNEDDFKPGAKIKINAGYEKKEETVFQGIVIKHCIKIFGENSSRLVIEARDDAVKMTVGRKNANYIDSKDSDIISKLINDNGAKPKVEATATEYKELVQYYCTDWDYVLARAEVNGYLVFVEDSEVTVGPPDTSGTPELKVTYGDDLMEFQAEMDARTQLKAVKARTWDMKKQAVIEESGTKPEVDTHGDITPDELAKVIGLDSYDLLTSAPVTKAGVKAWANARWLRAGLSKIRGRMKFQGSAKAKPGKMIELNGVGKRFEGNVYVSSVFHDISDGNWTTEAEFGLDPDWFIERKDVVAPTASGFLPGIGGLQIGVVKKLDEDPEGEQKIQVKVPVMQNEKEGVWARLANFYASSDIGAFFIPEIGDEVVLGYFNNDPCHPVVLGSLYSSKKKPPYSLTADNYIKAIVTRSKMKIEFDDEKKVTTIVTPGKNKIVISDEDKSILLEDQNKNTVKLGTDGISMDSPKDISITAKGKITIDAATGIEASSKADVKVDGLNITNTAKVGFTGKGSATAELSASGQTTVKGAIVMIN